MVLRTSLTPLGSKISYSYKSGTILAFESGEHTFIADLPKGVFKICLVGSGASGASWWFNSYGWGSTGGSAAVVELVFYNHHKQTIELYAGGSVTSKNQNGNLSFMKLNDIEMIVAYGGSRGNSGSGGAGGSYKINTEKLQIVESLITTNGYSGRTGISGGCGTVNSASPYEDWGCSSESYGTAGGFRLEYLRAKP